MGLRSGSVSGSGLRLGSGLGGLDRHLAQALHAAVRAGELRPQRAHLVRVRVKVRVRVRVRVKVRVRVRVKVRVRVRGRVG